MEYDFESNFNKEYSPVTRKIIRLLSNNSRITVSEIAKELKMSRSTIASRLKKIEQAFQISYTLGLDATKLGLDSPHVILVRFEKKPDYEKIRGALARTYVVQFAARIKGTYDLLIYANAYSLPEYLTWDMRMRSELMPSYKARWYTSDVSFSRLGFQPVRSEAIEKAKLPKKEREMLKVLNQNSRIPFNQLSKTLGMNYKTTVYNFNKLIKLGYIKRFTITMRLRSDISLMTMFNNFVPTQNYKGVEELAKNFFTKDDRTPLVNRFLMCSNLVGAYDFFTLGAYDDPKIGYSRGILLYNKLFKKYDITNTEYGTIEEVLVGMLPIRSIDAAKEFGHFHI